MTLDEYLADIRDVWGGHPYLDQILTLLEEIRAMDRYHLEDLGDFAPWEFDLDLVLWLCSRHALFDAGVSVQMPHWPEAVELPLRAWVLNLDTVEHPETGERCTGWKRHAYLIFTPTPLLRGILAERDAARAALLASAPAP